MSNTFPFPPNPVNGQTYQLGDTVFTYYSATDEWVGNVNGQLIGATGPTGATGPEGATGAAGSSIGVRATVFTSNGTFTIPSGVTAVKVTVVGGGGGGSQQATGAGGAVAIKYLTGLTPGNTLSVTVGAAGPGTSNTSSTGGNSSVASGTQSITTIQANGGVTPATLQAVGSSATTSGADIAINGGVSRNPASYPSVGADSMYGTGGGSSVVFACCTITPGSAATGYGAGGGRNYQGTGYAGSPGLVIFEY